MKHAILLAAAVTALAGCASPPAPVPYRPQRAVVAAIPPDRARDELRRVLAQSWQENPNLLGGKDEPPLVVQTVDEAGFVLRIAPGSMYHGDSRFGPWTFKYAGLAPAMYSVDFRGRIYCVSLNGVVPTKEHRMLWHGCLWFKEAEYAETAFDAIESLRAAPAAPH